MTASQQRAIDHLKYQITRRCSNHCDDEAIQPVLTRFEVDEAEWGISVIAEAERTGLPEGNLLRVLDHEYWMALIGKRGKITLKMGPDALKQFKGDTYFGMHVDYE